MNKQTRYAIRLPDGRCLGRYTITGDIVPVPPVFAHIFDDLETAKAPLEYARAALGFPDAELAPLSECLKPRSKPNP
ncbi:MAG: hypothetical protein KGR69_01550 [Verrucomicrobia bacterium]|nr:hypothetical protein [Verrucomicrobiota bacterium]